MAFQRFPRFLREIKRFLREISCVFCEKNVILRRFCVKPTVKSSVLCDGELSINNLE